MAENRLKIRICRMLRSPLASCKSKDKLSDDVVETRQHYRLVELFSPPLMAEQSLFISKKISTSLRSPLLSYDTFDGRKCPPASPIISPLNTTFYEPPKAIKKTNNPRSKKPMNRNRGRKSKYYNCDEEDDERASLFSGRRCSSSSTSRRSTATVEDSLAVVKSSNDPYTDFRTSMVEMIVEKQIFAAKDLEYLLQRFLSLNAYHHHKVIIQVFAEIWEALF